MIRHFLFIPFLETVTAQQIEGDGEIAPSD